MIQLFFNPKSPQLIAKVSERTEPMDCIQQAVRSLIVVNRQDEASQDGPLVDLELVRQSNTECIGRLCSVDLVGPSLERQDDNQAGKEREPDGGCTPGGPPRPFRLPPGSWPDSLQ